MQKPSSLVGAEPKDQEPAEKPQPSSQTWHLAQDMSSPPSKGVSVAEATEIQTHEGRRRAQCRHDLPGYSREALHPSCEDPALAWS